MTGGEVGEQQTGTVRETSFSSTLRSMARGVGLDDDAAPADDAVSAHPTFWPRVGPK